METENEKRAPNFDDLPCVSDFKELKGYYEKSSEFEKGKIATLLEMYSVAKSDYNIAWGVMKGYENRITNFINK